LKIQPEQLLRLISDRPWPGCQVQLWGMTITWMSSGIASMLLVGILLVVVVISLARRWRPAPTGAANVLEILVVFVRDMIARPTLKDEAYRFLPFLLTMFLFILGMNLFGILPLEPLTELTGYPVGGVATSIPAVCAALASISLLSIVFLGLRHQAIVARRRHAWPMWVCWLASPLLWFLSLSPRLPGKAGIVFVLPLAGLELIGALAKCFSLLVRLFANMVSGHTLLALLMLFFLEALAIAIRGGGYHVGYVGPFVIAGSVVVNLLELLVAGLQAYIFTFLTAMFLSLYGEVVHH